MKVIKNIQYYLLGIGLISFVFASFISTTSPDNKILKIVIPPGWPKPVYDFNKNPVTQGGFELGRSLFYDPMLSGDSTISCASCHLQQTNFTHVDHALSHGIYGRKGTRNSSIIMNVAWSKNFMWDGGVNHIETQPLAPITSPQEMNSSLNEIVTRLKNSPYYIEKFKKVYGPDTEITGQYILKSLSQYMLMLQSYNAKYDRVKRKEAGYVFTESEERGYQLFKTHCASCHTEPLFTNNSFENNGLAPDDFLKDGGRIKITKQLSDSLKFKVPSLRNVELSYPYMHDGRYRNIQMVLFHYSEDVHGTINLSEKLPKPLGLSEQNKNDMVAFLKTLTDTTFLNNPLYKYVPY